MQPDSPEARSSFGGEFSSDFQEKTVCALYQDPSFLTSVSEILQPSYFEESHTRWTSRAILNVYKRTGSASTKGILIREASKALQKGKLKEVEIGRIAQFITKLQKPIKERSYIKEEIFNFCKNQALRVAILNAAEQHLPQGNYDKIQAEIANIAAMDLYNNMSPGLYPFKTWEERQLRRENFKPNGITTGLRLDNYLLPKGLPPRSANLVIAPSGRGKTAILIHFALMAAIEAKKKVVVYSLELDQDMMADRADARAIMYPVRLMKAHGREVRSKWKNFGTAVSDNLIIKSFPAASLKMAGVEAHVRLLEQRAFYPDMIVMDHIDLLLPSVTYKSEHENQGQAMLDFRQYVQRRNLVGWTATQSNRESMKEDTETVRMEHTGTSIKKPQHADFAFSISQSDQEKKKKEARLSLIKNRFGPSDVEVKVTVDHDLTLFEDKN